MNTRTLAVRRPGRWSDGLTVVEVLVAITVLGIVTATIATAYISSIRHNSDAGRRTQSAQMLNAVGRRVAGADSAVLAFADAPIEFDYGQLSTAFPELSGEGFASPELYRVTVSNQGAITLGQAQIIHYQITVCTRAQGEATERCVSGDTAGPPAVPEEGGSYGLPGIN